MSEPNNPPTPALHLEQLASLAEQNPDPVLRFDHTGHLTYSNQAARELARTSGHGDISELLPAETLRLVQECLTGTRPKLSFETSLGGRSFAWTFFRGLPGPVVLCQISDVTERQQLEAQLRHTQKLDSVGQLAAGIAHDFNNVLTVIQGHTGLLRSETPASPAMAESLQQIARAAERGSKLTTQLLAFSRRNPLRARPLALNELLTQLSSLLHRTLGEDVACQFSYASELPAILADPSLIEQVVLNLALNAREAMPQGGQLVVSTSTVDIDEAYARRHSAEARAGRFICLTVSDTGCGMDAAMLGRIFEPFFTTKPGPERRGIGLATAYGIVRQHQGWIEVRSQPGRGSTFRVFFPVATSGHGTEGSQPTDRGAARGTETILVVEDEPPVRWIIKEVLGKYGYQIIEAGNGVEALAQWHQHHGSIALLLTDMVMPVGLSGRELAEKFSAQKPGLKVIYISGYSLQAAGAGLPLLDGLNFLQKPFDDAKLAQAVRQCLDT